MHTSCYESYIVNEIGFYNDVSLYDYYFRSKSLYYFKSKLIYYFKSKLGVNRLSSSSEIPIIFFLSTLSRESRVVEKWAEQVTFQSNPRECSEGTLVEDSNSPLFGSSNNNTSDKYPLGANSATLLVEMLLAGLLMVVCQDIISVMAFLLYLVTKHGQLQSQI